MPRSRISARPVSAESLDLIPLNSERRALNKLLHTRQVHLVLRESIRSLGELVDEPFPISIHRAKRSVKLVKLPGKFGGKWICRGSSLGSAERWNFLLEIGSPSRLRWTWHRRQRD